MDELATLAAEINASVENIGARRLHTVMERLLDEISFTATDRTGPHPLPTAPSLRSPGLPGRGCGPVRFQST